MVLIFNPATTFTTYKLLDLLISKNISFKLIDPTNIHSLSIKQNDGIPTDIIINGELINLQLVSCVFSTSSNLNLCIDLEDKDFTEFEKGASVIFLNTIKRRCRNCH